MILECCRGQAEKEFKVEVEAIGKVRHKNLVGLIGYCAEGVKRLTNLSSALYYYHHSFGLTQPIILSGPFSCIAFPIFIQDDCIRIY